MILKLCKYGDDWLTVYHNIKFKFKFDLLNILASKDVIYLKVKLLELAPLKNRLCLYKFANGGYQVCKEIRRLYPKGNEFVFIQCNKTFSFPNVIEIIDIW